MKQNTALANLEPNMYISVKSRRRYLTILRFTTPYYKRHTKN